MSELLDALLLEEEEGGACLAILGEAVLWRGGEGILGRLDATGEDGEGRILGELGRAGTAAVDLFWGMGRGWASA